MATTVFGTQGRKFTIDGTNRHQPASVFVSGPRAFTMEFDKEVFIDAVCSEFGLARIEERPILLSA